MLAHAGAGAVFADKDLRATAADTGAGVLTAATRSRIGGATGAAQSPFVAPSKCNKMHTVFFVSRQPTAIARDC